MEVQTTKALKDYEGNDMRQPKETTGADGKVEVKMTTVTFRDAVLNLLNNWKQGEDPSGEDKARSYMLTTRMFDGPTAKLSIEEAAFIKERAAAMAIPLVMGQVNEILENAAQLDSEGVKGDGKDDDPKK